ncbi:MAG TPA: hypothetical protein VF215_15875, partial [Thermoanaerobaculia bacterium]
LLPDDPWWKYYKKKVASDFQEGIQISKFAQTPGFSLGAGVSLATSSDTGVVFASKLFFLLALPDVFLLQGQGRILKGRILLTDPTDPPFFALIAITKSSIETAFGVHYAIPSEGDEPGGIVTVDAIIEMGFFWGSSAAWYVNIGRDSPESERVLVRLLKIIDAYFYFMMSGAGIRAGAGASYNLTKKFGPLKAELRASLDTAGHVSFRRTQIGASIRIGGSVDVSIFGFGFGFSAAASLAAEGTKPFTITGSLEVCVRVLRKDRCAKFEFTWIFNQDLDKSETILLKEDRRESGKALNIHTLETFDLWTGDSLPAAPEDVDPYMIPLDSYIDIELLKSVLPAPEVIAAYGGNTMGTHYIEYFAPQRGKTDRVRHEYILQKAELLYYDGGWKPYDIYASATPAPLKPFITSDLTTLKQGSWQYQEPNRHNKLRILAQTPLTYLSQGSGDHVIEDSGITAESIFCAPEPIAPTCVTFEDYLPVVKTPVPLEDGRQYFHRRVQIRVAGTEGAVVEQVVGASTRALRIEAGSSVEIFLDEPAVQIRLKIQTDTDSAVVRFYGRVPIPPRKAGLPLTNYEYSLAATRAVAPGAMIEVSYDDLRQPVEKIVIEAGECRLEPPLVCDTALTAEANDLEHFLDTLAHRGQLLGPVVDLCARDCEGWDGVFFNTTLYGARVDPVYFRYSVITATGGELHAELSDWKGFRCAIDLVVIDGPAAIDWTQVVRFFHIRADSHPVAGPNTTFLIDADLQTPKGITHLTLRGKSCYPITNCRFPGNGAPGPLTAQATSLGELLHSLVGTNRLVQPRVKLESSETVMFDRVFPGTQTETRRKVWLTTSVDADMRQLQVSLGDESAGGVVTLGMPHGRSAFSFDDVVGFSNLRPALSELPQGTNRRFLIDARIRQQGGESTVTIAGEAPFPVHAAAVPEVDILPQNAIFPSGSSECALYLYEICMLDYPSAAFNDTLPT